MFQKKNSKIPSSIFQINKWKPRGEESTEVWITQKQGKREETLTERNKRSPDERHT